MLYKELMKHLRNFYEGVNPDSSVIIMFDGFNRYELDSRNISLNEIKELVFKPTEDQEPVLNPPKPVLEPEAA